jgi:putative pyruvate formate lyase activating enzyme
MMTRGVIVRILLLPGHLAEAKLNVKYLYESFGDKIYISLMSQYTPFGDLPPPLNRRVTKHEYEQLCDYALKKGLKNGFIQEGKSASESFIPEFDLRGV